MPRPYNQTTKQPNNQTTKQPYNQIDHLRCLLTAMVILVHTVNFGAQYPHVKDCINLFFMPAFLLVTGFLVNIGKLARGWRPFLLYMARIALPYTVMVLGFAILSLHLPVRGAIADCTPRTLARTLLVTSIGPYWFLHTMMVCAAPYWLVWRLFGRCGPAMRYCLFGSLLLALSLFTPLLSLRSAAFYFAGAGIRLFHGDITRLVRPTLWASVPFLVTALAGRQPRHEDLTVMVMAVSFISFVMAASGRLHGTAGQVTGYIGRNTLPVYLFHPIFTMAAKYCLPLFSFDPTGLTHAAATVIIGIAGSLAIAKALDGTRLAYIFARRRILR